MKLNEKLIKLRKENGLSQEEFGNKINVSRQAVSKWENEETKPDIDKIQEIGKTFNISFDYLLNDEIETLEKISPKVKRSYKKIILKILLIVFLIYLLTCIYKFIALYRFYLIANSFSEENYSMGYTVKNSNNFGLNDSCSFYTTKVGDIILKQTYSFDEPDPIVNSEGNILPYIIEYSDLSKNICYELFYDRNESKYFYRDTAEHDYYNNYNFVKENTLDHIPSNFKEIFLMSINPEYFVSIFRREIRGFDIINNARTRVILNTDYLIESLDAKFEYEGNMQINFSYDYVPGHFKDDRIKDPLEEYKDMIIYEE